jgi:hypothetical protein
MRSRKRQSPGNGSPVARSAGSFVVGELDPGAYAPGFMLTPAPRVLTRRASRGEIFTHPHSPPHAGCPLGHPNGAAPSGTPGGDPRSAPGSDSPLPRTDRCSWMFCSSYSVSVRSRKIGHPLYTIQDFRKQIVTILLGLLGIEAKELSRGG